MCASPSSRSCSIIEASFRPVAEQNVAQALDRNRYDVEVVHLGEAKGRLQEAEAAGVKSVPALVLDGQPYHINHGADLAALK